MPKNQGSSALVIIIILTIIAGGGYWVWKSKTVTPTPAPVTDTNIEPPAPSVPSTPASPAGGPSVDMAGSGIPQISNIVPSSGFPGTVVTLSGNGFTSGPTTYIGISESGQKSFDPNSLSPTKLTFTIPSDLAPGNHDITVFVSARQTPTSNKVTFTVLSSTNNQ